jgi:hypothetical protein
LAPASAARIDSAILADGTDKNAGEAAQVSETRATHPVFPPGRYGRRRDGRRHLALPILFGALVLGFAVFLTVRLYGAYGDPDYDPRIVGWSEVTTSNMTIDFTVRVPAGGSAACVLRARSYDGAEVGRRTVTVTAAPGEIIAEAKEPVQTTALASHGDVVRCRPVDK